MRLKFPHFPRFITATVLPTVSAFLLWGVTASLIGYNIYLINTKPLTYAHRLYGIFASPLSISGHERLAQTLWNAGSYAFAKQELLLAIELAAGNSSQTESHDAATDRQVLGAATTPGELLQSWENAPKQQAAQTKYWQGIVRAHPDYRDAYIQLASLSYTRGNLIQTRSYLLQAQALDPNGASVDALVEFIAKQLK